MFFVKNFIMFQFTFFLIKKSVYKGEKKFFGNNFFCFANNQ